MDDTPDDVEIFPGYQRMLDELRHAEKARLDGNEGKARVCARRAAGIAAGEYLKQSGAPDPGPSAYDRLRYLLELTGLSPHLREITSHLLERVTEEFTLPVEADLIADARSLAAELLGSLPIHNIESVHASPSGNHGQVSEPAQPQEKQMTFPYHHFQNLSLEIPEVPSDSILSRTIFSDDQLKAILFRFAEGQELSEHTASVPATIHILDGEATLQLGTDRFEASAGTWAHMQPNLPHSVFAKTPTTMLLLMLRGK